MSKPPKKSKQPALNNVVSLEDFRAKQAVRQHEESWKYGSQRLGLPPMTDAAKKWLDQYGDL